ncbi:MAG: DUF3991 domain-containing protein [Patescibacteria group bacterium]
MYQKHDFSRYKSDINLSHYASSLGYELDPKKTTKSSLVMKHPNGDKVIISKRGSNYVYFSVLDDKDNGTIVDFIRKRTEKTFPEIGQELQKWVKGGGGISQNIPFASDIQSQEYNPERIKALFSRVKQIKGDDYLQNVRKIPLSTLQNQLFVGRIYRDFYGNVVFPHYDHTGVCGLELKNTDKGVFVRGSAKGLWTSTINPNAQILVIAESPIDGLSYFTLFPELQKSGVVFASVSGGLRPHQVQLINELIKKLPQLQKIILAVDHDQGGERIEKTIREGVKNAGVFASDMLTHVPEKIGDDWNEVLKNREQK